MKLTSLGICAVLLVSAGTVPVLSSSMRAELSPQEHALYAQQMRGANWRSLTLQQRCARMQQVRVEWQSMSPAARTQLKQQLDARWHTLPVAQQQSINQRIAAREARRAQDTGQRGQRRCAG